MKNLLPNQLCSMMKYVCYLSILFSANVLQAQSPLAIPYQAVARNTTGNLISNLPISLRFSIHDLTVNGTVVYKETQAVITNSLGLFMTNIGQGTSVLGNFAGINWATGSKFIEVELDAAGGANYISMGTTQLMSVPYALFANKSADLPSGTINGNTMHWNGTSWVADNGIFNDGSNIGIGTSSPAEQLHTTGGVRHQSLAGVGSRIVYADSNGKLNTAASLNPIYSQTSTAAPVSIPDNSCVGSSGSIIVSGLPQALASSSITVKVNITHTYVGDLRAYLYAPDGSIINLFYSNGGSGDNFVNTVFTDSAATNLASSGAPFTGYFKPEGNMSTQCFVTPNVSTFSAMSGGTINPNGTWTLRVFDSYSIDTGVINNWSVSFNTGANTSSSLNSILPSQIGHVNGVLTTNGANPSWTTGVPVKYYMIVNGVYPSYPNGCTSECMGSIVMWPYYTNFDGYIKPCNGQLLSIAQYNALFSIIGTTYGGDGVTTFALPNLNGAGQTPVGHQ